MTFNAPERNSKGQQLMCVQQTECPRAHVRICVAGILASARVHLLCWTRARVRGVERKNHFRVRRGAKAGRRFIRRIKTFCVKQFKSSKQQLGVILENIVLISRSPIPMISSDTSTVKPYNVLPIPTLVKHRAAKKIKILISQTFTVSENSRQFPTHFSTYINKTYAHIIMRHK